MINIVKKELEFDNELKKKIEFICSFCNTTPTIINGNIRKIERTNLSYIEPHRIIIKGITFLAFNYSKTLYVGNLSNKLEINELESFIKQLTWSIVIYINFLKTSHIWLKMGLCLDIFCKFYIIIRQENEFYVFEGWNMKRSLIHIEKLVVNSRGVKGIR